MDFILREIANNTLDTGFNDQLLEAADYINSLEQRLAEIEAKLPRWIPVTERLPKPGATVLAVDNSGDMGVCTFVNAKFVGECFGFEAYLNDGGWDCSASKVIGEYVTHWMKPEPPASGDSWSLFMSIDTDDDAAVEFEGVRYCLYAEDFNKQFEGPLGYLAEQVEKITVPNRGKYASRLQEHLANLRVAIKTGTPFHVSDNGNQDVEITLGKR